MSFSDVQQSVQQAWAFTWPPVIFLLAMIGLFRGVAPELFSAVRKWLSGMNLPTRFMALKVALRPYGLDKLIPIAALFVVVFTLFLTSVVVHLLGNSVPPRVSIQPATTFARTVGERRLACLWSFFPWADIGELQTIIHKRLESAEKLDASVKYWSDTRGKFYGRFDATKFLLAWTLFWGIAEKWRGPVQAARLFSAVCLLAVLASIYLVGFLRAVDQSQHAEENAAVALWLNKKACIDPQGTPTALTPQQKEQWNQERKDSGWSITLPFGNYLQWVRRDARPPGFS